MHACADILKLFLPEFTPKNEQERKAHTSDNIEKDNLDLQSKKKPFAFKAKEGISLTKNKQ